MRSLSRDARHERRVQVIRLRETGLTYEEIAAQTGLSRTGVFDICRRYARGGAKALQDAIGGRQVGEGRCLSKVESDRIGVIDDYRIARAGGKKFQKETTFDKMAQNRPRIKSAILP